MACNEKVQCNIDRVGWSVITLGMSTWVNEFVPGWKRRPVNEPGLNYRLDSFKQLERLQKIYTRQTGLNFRCNTLTKTDLILFQYRGIYNHTFLMKVYLKYNFWHNCILLYISKGLSGLVSL